MPLTFLRCRLNRHTPDRRNAPWDGVAFVSVCQGCGKPIRRIRHRHWVVDERPTRIAPPVT
jgi:hypothetical protein